LQRFNATEQGSRQRARQKDNMEVMVHGNEHRAGQSRAAKQDSRAGQQKKAAPEQGTLECVLFCNVYFAAARRRFDARKPHPVTCCMPTQKFWSLSGSSLFAFGLFAF